MTMTSEDGDISALLSEPSLSEEPLEASESDDILPALLKSIKSNEKAVEISPEEAAWADSCFVQTSELSDDDWGAMRKALLDVLEKPMESLYEASEVVHDQGLGVGSEAEPHSLRIEEVSQHDDVHMERSEDNDGDKGNTEACEFIDVIRGADEYGKKIDGYTAKPEDGDDLDSSDVLEQAESRDSIFKVWDLDVSFSDNEGELELIKDLKELLKDNPLEAAYPPPSDTVQVLSQVNVDELVAGLGDLSLQKTNE